MGLYPGVVRAQLRLGVRGYPCYQGNVDLITEGAETSCRYKCDFITLYFVAVVSPSRFQEIISWIFTAQIFLYSRKQLQNSQYKENMESQRKYNQEHGEGIRQRLSPH